MSHAPFIPLLADIDNLRATLELLARLFLALVVGAGLGWDRASKEKPAGIRTHMLVSLGAAVAMLATLKLSGPQWADSGPLNREASRVIAGIVGGVGFLGAGAIIKEGASVHGITTAASIWVAATIGLACGLGQYTLAVTGTLLTLFVLRVMAVIEERFFKH
jgi:putative Mg2+ transporter-C (MgtC) family protein